MRRINLQQMIKWTVYGLLLLNWGLYVQEEWQNAQFTLAEGGSFLEWTSAFGTSLDETAWFGLLFLWELETYALSDDALNRLVQWAFLGIRGICYLFLAHTVFAWATTFYDLEATQSSSEVTSLCQFAGQDISYAYNKHYTLIDKRNCASLSAGTEFYYVESTAITDRAGFDLEVRSAWIDLQDAVTWLLIMFSIELGIMLQERDITGGPLTFVSRAVKVFYGILFFDAAYWAWLGHWLWTWDQTLWICGFWVIEYNMKEWRDQIDGEQEPVTT